MTPVAKHGRIQAGMDPVTVSTWVTADHRADARRYLIRTGNADVLDVLGLDALDDGVPRCPGCQQPFAVSDRGRCRRETCPHFLARRGNSRRGDGTDAG